MQEEKRKDIKALLCQIKPIFKEKISNIKRAKVSLQNYSSKDEIDFVLFPEMSFTGYNFLNQEDALPLACSVAEGEEFQFASAQAKRLNTYVCYGYIEKCENEGKIVLFNSVGIIGRKGEWIMNVRKTHLFFNDKLWCEQGDGFKHLQIVNCKGDPIKCGIAICMDINPKDFTSGQWQFGDFVTKQKCDVILFLTNWVDSSVKELEQKTVLSIYNYWLHRLTPVLQSKKQTLFLACDRVGGQYSHFDKKNILFLGSSCGIKLNPNQIIQKLDMKNEGYLMIETNLPK